MASDRKSEWYKHGWGLVAAILLFPIFIPWYAWAKSNWSKNVKIGVTAAMAVLVIVSGVINGTNTSTPTVASTPKEQPKPAATQTAQEQPKPEKPKKDTSPLNAGVQKSYDVAGIEITNQEQVNWDKCQLVLNGDYKRNIANPLEPNAPLNNPYSLFTKSDGTRFNLNTTAVKNLYIGCTVNGNSRYNYYTF